MKLLGEIRTGKNDFSFWMEKYYIQKMLIFFAPIVTEENMVILQNRFEKLPQMLSYEMSSSYEMEMLLKWK
jgi:hypothetical protein